MSSPTTSMATGYDQTYAAKLTSPADAVAPMQDKELLLVAMAIGQPPAILEAIADRVRADDLTGLRVYYKLAMGDPMAKTLLSNGVVEKTDLYSFFLSGPDHAIIKKQAHGRKLLSFVPVNFSQLPRLIEQILDVDTFVVRVSPMDKGGYFSLGTNNDYASTAARCCKRLIVEVNPHMPRVFGQSQIHVDEVTAIVEDDTPLFDVGMITPSEESRVIASFVAPLVPNGATIQLGIGKAPSGIAPALANHEDLGIHTELFSPPLAQCH
jgi:itaconate CoA-transferase